SVRLKAAPFVLPPVIEEIRIGAASCLLKRDKERSILSKSNSGSALWLSLSWSKPVEIVDWTSSTRVSIRLSSFLSGRLASFFIIWCYSRSYLKCQTQMVKLGNYNDRGKNGTKRNLRYCQSCRNGCTEN